jgi:hypothetical protein
MTREQAIKDMVQEKTDTDLLFIISNPRMSQDVKTQALIEAQRRNLAIKI